jgi:hypothetical protein
MTAVNQVWFAAEPPNKLVALRGGHLLHSRQQPIGKERAMREAFMFTQKVIAAYLEDMTLSANRELGNFGACRRR